MKILFFAGFLAGLGLVFADEAKEPKLKGCEGVVCPGRFQVCELGEDMEPICVRRCKQCDEEVNSSPVCGTDGKPYDSACYLELQECMTDKKIFVACEGACPCDPKEVEKMDPKLVHKLQRLRLKVRREKRLEKELAREAASVEAWRELNENNKKVVQEAKDLTKREKILKWQKLKEALKREEEIAKERVLEEMMMQRSTKEAEDQGKSCEMKNLEQLPIRLVDWFHVLKSNELRKLMKKADEGEKSVLKELRFVDAKLRSLYIKLTCKKKNAPLNEIYCLEPVRWMFMYLDKNKDMKLNHSELSVIDDIDTEYCLRPFFKSCDVNANGFLEQREFCKCLCVEPPCTRAMEEVPTILVKGVPQPVPGHFSPTCDEDGFYMPRQCNGSDRRCWCVDRNGGEIAGTSKTVASEADYPDCGLDNTDYPTERAGTEDKEETEKSEEFKEP